MEAGSDHGAGGAGAPARWPLWLAFPLAVAIAVASLAGLGFPAVYARETASWAAQAVAQDGVDLAVVVPLLIIAGALALLGNRIAAIVLTGGLLFTVYSFLIYGFALHFNALFLVYCAALGMSAYAFAGMALQLRAGAAIGPVAALAGWYLVVTALLFAALWLATIIPALSAGTIPADIVAAGLPTNPVHVIDLSLYLPGQLAVGLSLRRGGALGRRLAPALLVFATLMAVLLATIMVVSSPSGPAGGLVAGAAFLVFGLVNLGVLVALLRSEAGVQR